MSGVACEDSISSKFQAFKIQKQVRYYVYKIEGKKLIKIEKEGARDATYDDFCSDLPDNEPRYGLIDLEFQSKDGRSTSKLLFVSWNPDSGSIRDKMLYSASKESIKNALHGVGIHINATDRDELDFEESILPVCKKFT